MLTSTCAAHSLVYCGLTWEAPCPAMLLGNEHVMTLEYGLARHSIVTRLRMTKYIQHNKDTQGTFLVQCAVYSANVAMMDMST